MCALSGWRWRGDRRYRGSVRLIVKKQLLAVYLLAICCSSHKWSPKWECAVTWTAALCMAHGWQASEIVWGRVQAQHEVTLCLQAAAALAELASGHSADKEFESPYTQEAAQEGFDIPIWEKVRMRLPFCSEGGGRLCPCF